MYDRAALLAQTSLPDLADDLLGPRTGSQRSPTWPCPNPGHAQTGRTPPLSVFRTRWGEERWRCFGCGEGGSAIDLVMAANGGTIRDALDLLSARSGVRDDHRYEVRRPTPLEPKHRDPEGLARFVRTCAETLWTPAGRPILDWLTRGRALPVDVLRLNMIGADVGTGFRPKGMPRGAGVVLPTIVDGEPTYAHKRVLHPGPDRPRYLNASWHLAENPKLCRLSPTERRHDEIIVSEGAIDGLSAAAAGYDAVAFFGTGAPDETVALALSRLPGPLVLAFDPDGPGECGLARLVGLLAAHQRPVSVLDLPGGDLNEHLLASGDAWPDRLSEAVASARRTARAPTVDLTV